MATQRLSSDALVGQVTALVDATLLSYGAWRADADCVAEAYRRWAAGQGSEKAKLFAAYMAALDQEEAAATSLDDALTQLRRRSKYAGH